MHAVCHLLQLFVQRVRSTEADRLRDIATRPEWSLVPISCFKHFSSGHREAEKGLKMKVQILAVPWYRFETFARLRAIFDDADKIHGTYEEWFAYADAFRKREEGRGVRVICVDIEPEEFSQWCRANGIKLDADARHRFASVMAYRIVTGGQSSGGVH
jgi:hypothetical protein